MAEGYERRGDVKDDNMAGEIKAATVPLSPVQGPQPSSFSRVGEAGRKLADSLGKADIGLQKYMEKRRADWELEGQMAFAEGKTEQEIAQSGNRYTMAGFMSMKAKTAGTEWMQQAKAEIENGDKTLSSQEYQAKLKEQYKELTQNVAGQDQYTRNLMSTMAANMFPQLVSQQIVSNNAWREQETKDSYTSMLVSEASANGDPESLLELLDPQVSGLSKERHFEAVTDAVSLLSDEDNTTILDMIGLTEQEKLSSMENETGLPEGLLAAVMQQESGGKRYGKDGKVLTSSAGAKGEMQVMDGTTYDPGFGVTPAQNDSLEERARVGRDYLAAMYDRYDGDLEATLVAYNAGPGNADKFVAAGKDYNVLPKKSETQPYVRNIMGDLSDDTGVAVKRNSATAAMLKIGFTPSQISKMSSAYEKVTARKSREFNKERELWERNLQKEVELNGNLPEALTQIEMKMEQEGYTDAWAEGVASKVMSSMNSYEKEHRSALEIENAIATKRVAVLDSPAKVQKAIDVERERIMSIVQTQQSIPPEQRAEMVREEFSNFLVENQVVDKTWASSMQLDLSRVLGKDGEVRPEAIRAYNDYLAIAEKSNTGFASKFLDEESKKMVALVESYTVDQYMNPAQALMQASEIRAREKTGQFVAPQINSEQLAGAVDELVDSVDSGWFGWRNDKTRAFEVYGSELDQMRNSPVLKNMLQQAAYKHMLLDPNLTPQAAARMAKNDIQARAEYAMGNVLMSGKSSTIREDMGIQDWTDPKTVDKVMLDYLREYGETIWGSEFNEFAMFGKGEKPDEFEFGDLVPDRSVIWQSVRDSARGVPQMSIRYDTDRKGFIVDRWLDKERTALANTPHFVPAKELGEWARESENGTLNPVNQAAWYDPRPDWMRKK